MTMKEAFRNPHRNRAVFLAAWACNTDWNCKKCGGAGPPIPFWPFLPLRDPTHDMPTLINSLNLIFKYIYTYIYIFNIFFLWTIIIICSLLGLDDSLSFAYKNKKYIQYYKKFRKHSIFYKNTVNTIFLIFFSFLYSLLSFCNGYINM